MNSEELHVAEFYQTIIIVAILILLISEILIFKEQLWNHYFSLRLKQHSVQNQWMNNSEVKDGNDLQKTAIESIRREITEYQNKNNQAGKVQSKQDGEKEEDPQAVPLQVTAPQLEELKQSQKSIFMFYTEYNNFISEHVSIIFSLLVLGILTSLTRIYSLASFFCYLFANLIFNFLHIEERLKAQYKRGIVIRRVVKVISNCFLLGIFVTYWIF